MSWDVVGGEVVGWEMAREDGFVAAVEGSVLRGS
jgi:hypothetical protein